MKFTKHFLMEELGLPYENTLVDNIIDTTRWSEIHEIVFAHDGKFYQTTYSQGLTELQDESAWEMENDIDCDEVELKEVTVMKWVLKK